MHGLPNWETERLTQRAEVYWTFFPVVGEIRKRPLRHTRQWDAQIPVYMGGKIAGKVVAGRLS